MKSSKKKSPLSSKAEVVEVERALSEAEDQEEVDHLVEEVAISKETESKVDLEEDTRDVVSVTNR